jgi:8-oxo-dGTP diphosphatase
MVPVRQFGERVEGVEYIPRPGAYAVSIDAQGRVAVIWIQRDHLEWYVLAGGGIEGEESAVEAVVREVREETGLEVEVIREIGRANQYVYAKEEGLYFNKLGVFFLVGVVTDHRDAQEEGHTLRWLAPQEALEQLYHPSQAWILAQALGNE